MVVVCQTQRRQGRLRMLKWSEERRWWNGRVGLGRGTSLHRPLHVATFQSHTECQCRWKECTRWQQIVSLVGRPTVRSSVVCTLSKRVKGTRIRFLKLTILLVLLDLPTKSLPTTTLIFRCFLRPARCVRTRGRWYPILTPLMALTTSGCSRDGDTVSS